MSWIPRRTMQTCAREASIGHRHGVTARDLVVALCAGFAVLAAQAIIDGNRDAEADRRENLRFVREQAANGKADEVSFRGIDLSGRNLGGLNLSGADLQDANFSGADLSGTQLIGAELYRADLSSTRLGWTNFTDAELNHADLQGATFEGTFFNDANLFDADLRDITNTDSIYATANFDGAKLVETDLSGVRLSSDLSKAFISNVKFNGADLSHTKLPAEYGSTVGPRLDSICYNFTTKWPDDFRTEKLPEIRCEEMQEDFWERFSRQFNGARP